MSDERSGEATVAVQTKDLWSLVLDQQYVDPEDLSWAVVDQVQRGDLDFRSRLLIRDTIDALKDHWGPQKLAEWLRDCPVRAEIDAICKLDLGKPGFPFLRRQIMELTRSEDIRQFLGEIGSQLHHSVRIAIGGSCALILKGYLSRRTQDIDVVNELPPEIRALGNRLHELEQRYRIQLGHFQSHYLPSGWEMRLHSLEPFGQLSAYIVDVYDIFLSKLFSNRDKDRDDLRALAPQLDKEVLVRKLKETTQSFLVASDLRLKAETSWNIIFGEPLPS